MADKAISARASATRDELNLLIDGTIDHAIYMINPRGIVTIWNKGAERVKGWTESEAVGSHTSLFYPAEAVAAGKPDEDLRLARENGKFEEESWRVRKDGTEYLASVLITALYDKDGTLRGFGKVLRDITEQRASEAALRSSASHMRSILSTVPDAMIVIDERGKIVSFSTVAERLFGFTESQITGSNISRLMPDPDHSRHDGYITNYLTTGVRKIIGIGRIVIGKRRDGSTFPMSVSVAEAIGEDGQRLFTGFVRDLTERHKTQLRLEELQSELIHVARVSAMGTMASTLAHELNQPITAVANYVAGLEMLLENPDPADLPMIRSALCDTGAEAIRAGDIVRRLRNFVARGEVDKTVEDLPALVSEAAAFGLLSAREMSVTTLFDLDVMASPVLVDKVQIQQVLINLMRNAVEAMADSPERRLSVVSRDDEAGCVRVTVADTGPGVAPEIVAQLFTAFVSTKAEGMGLGLSICRTIIEANGGRIWLEPGEGGGSAFHFTWSRPPWSLPMADPRIVHIVDDEEAVRNSTGFLLKTSGYAVKTYASGAAFLKDAGTAQPGCVLLDVRMPDMDGCEVQQIMIQRGITMPVVVLSGHGDVPIAITTMKAGAVDFIEKPFEKAELLAAIEVAFERMDGVAGMARDAASAASAIATLTDRERDVLTGMARGLPNKSIAYDLDISPRTVEVHRANLMAKLGVKSMSGALRIAFAVGFGD